MQLGHAATQKIKAQKLHKHTNADTQKTKK